jgi:alkylation response protein AidB-like acyl-CoA dehydrogenase
MLTALYDRLVRDSLIFKLYEGTSQIQREIISRVGPITMRARLNLV